MKGSKMVDKRTCFIIGPIGEPNSKERTWANFLRDNIIKPAVTSCGYAEPARADDPDTTLIMPAVIEQMFEAGLVVADLTDSNENVYYELGIRHCAQKPSVHLIKTDQKPSFDLGDNQAIFVDETHIRVVQAVEDIKKRIKAIEKNPEKFLSQVQVYMTLKQFDVFKKVGNTRDKLIVRALTTLIQSISLQTSRLNKLYDELVEKPKQMTEQTSGTLAAIKAILQPSKFALAEAIISVLEEQQKQKDAQTKDEQKQ